ncbi:hypothetical protein DMQ35_09095 [Klebsiella quasipneumoniae]|nr:hypothetical protein DMQ35_09095 [Klebsiella quasipneumoniae]
MSDITQKQYWERNLPGNNTEVVALLSAARAGTSPVALLFRRMAAAPDPAYQTEAADPASAAPPGTEPLYAGWRLRLTRPTKLKQQARQAQRHQA